MARRKSRPPAAPPPAARLPVLRFLLVFGLLLAGFYALILQPWADRALNEYLQANAWLSGLILRGLGQRTEVHEVTIRSAAFAVSVRRGCDAVEPAWFFCAAVLAFPARWRQRLGAIVVGTIILLALNLVRIVSLFLIGVAAPGFFAVAHLEIWPAVFILCAIGLWLGWVRRLPLSRP